MVLREALSSENTPFETLAHLGKDILLDEACPASPQVNGVGPRNYRMHRHLSPAERAQLIDQYRNGKSTYKLARQFGIHRCTVVKHLQRAGIDMPTQRKMTPSLVERARGLYADGNSLATIGEQLGVDASTVHKAFKRAGVKMRDTHGRER